MRLCIALLLAIGLGGASATAQVDPNTALLERAGWDALKAGDARKASDAFRDAVAADPKNARLHLGAGLAAFIERRDDDAKRELERTLELDPKLTDAKNLLGRILYRSGDLAGAIRTFEQIVAATPKDRESADTLDRWRREASLYDRMRQSLNERFTVSYAGPAEQTLAAKVLESLDRAYWRIGEALSAFPTEPVAVVLYTTEQFRDVTRSPTWAAAAYDGTIRVPVRGALESSTELDRVLAHEFTHAMVRLLASRNVPTWLNEGLAAALESADLEWARTRVGRASESLPLSKLVSSFGRMTGNEAQLAYATSALAVRRLLDEAGGFAMSNLLRDLGEGVEFESAFLHRIQRSFASFQSDAP